MVCGAEGIHDLDLIFGVQDRTADDGRLAAGAVCRPCLAEVLVHLLEMLAEGESPEVGS